MLTRRRRLACCACCDAQAHTHSCADEALPVPGPSFEAGTGSARMPLPSYCSTFDSITIPAHRMLILIPVPCTALSQL